MSATIILEVLDHEGLHRYNDHWDIFQDIAEPHQVFSEDGSSSWVSSTQNEGIAELLEKAGLVKIYSQVMTINLCEVSKEWDSYQVDNFHKSRMAYVFLRQLVNDDVVEQVARRLIRQYGRTSPQFYGWDFVMCSESLKRLRYTGFVRP